VSEETQLKQVLGRAPTLLEGIFGTWTAATQKTRQTVKPGLFWGALSDGATTVVVCLLLPDCYEGSNKTAVYTVTTYIAYWIAVNVVLVRMMIKEVRYFQKNDT
jgi:uncharacterized membrane protein HdeD (DUF308 family)